MDELFEIPEDVGALSADALQQFIDATVARIDEIAADAPSFTNENRDSAALRAEIVEAVDALKAARERLATLEAEAEGADAGDGEDAEDEVEETAADGAALEAEEAAEGDAAEGEGAEGDAAADAELAAAVEAAAAVAAEAKEPKPKPITAAALPVQRRRPARRAAAAPREEHEPAISLTAAAESGLPLGTPFGDSMELAQAMIDRRKGFVGIVPEGFSEKYPVAFADWRGRYPADRDLVGKDEAVQAAIVAAATDARLIRANFDQRLKMGNNPEALVASGGLCAPVTPYYGLQMISVAERPVRSALPSFNADRGGIRAALPASLAAITTGVGAMTVAQDQAGGTTGTKSCQSIDCPPFVETDVEILWHCLRFGNLGARTFPERVAQWNNLVLAAHARLAERTLLTGIDTASTAVTAASWGLGASADLLSQVLVAAAGMRSRHRMAPDAVLRVLMPRWVLDLLVSDVYRSQFQRFDMGPADFVAKLRAGGVEPTFYIDSAAGKNQEFGVQSAGALLAFPSTVTWYLFPEGSFLYLDGGTLELGLVRDSVLNSTNDFEIFGESFENVAFTGVESLAITSTVCDSGITAGTHNPNRCGDYAATS